MLVSAPILSLFLAAAWSGSAHATAAQPAKTLEPGARVARRLSPGQVDSYQIALVEGRYVHVVIEQTSLDLTVRLVSPDGTIVAEVANPAIDYEPLPLSLIAPQDGLYRLEVALSRKSQSRGQYTLILADMRPATPADSKRIEAEKAYAEGDRLGVQDEEPKLREAIARYEMAAALWRELSDAQGECAALLRIGEVQWSFGDLKAAVETTQRGLASCRAAGDSKHEAVALNNLGTNYINLNEPQAALDVYEKALALSRSLGDRSTEAYLLHNIAFV